MTIVDHAKKCDPGKELYSFIVEGHDVVLFFNCFYRIVGVTSSDQYTPFKDLDRPMQVFLSYYFELLLKISELQVVHNEFAILA